MPKEYMPLNRLEGECGTLFATLNPDVCSVNNICRNGGIQQISRLPDLEAVNPSYHLGTDPDTITLLDFI